MGSNRAAVVIYPYLFQYRVKFHELVRNLLAAERVEYKLIYSSDPKSAAPRGDLTKLSWATDVRCDKFTLGSLELRYQHAFRAALSADLAIFQQENALLLNYPLQIARLFSGPKTAFIGHGKNFQSVNSNGVAENLKRFLTNKVDWWFAYTERIAQVVVETGFPRGRITVFNNAMDTSAIGKELASLTEGERSVLRDTLLDGSHNVGVYVGALYPMKRMGFLLDAAGRIRTSVHDFHLLIIGAGEDAPLAEAAAARHSWIHYLGPKFGREKSLLASLAKVFLMPGAGGLAVLDSLAYGIPMVATDYPLHGPEMEYLEHGVNGLKNIAANDPDAYAAAVARLLRNEGEWRRLRDGGRRALATYTVEAMSERFATGVLAALRAPSFGGSGERTPSN